MKYEMLIYVLGTLIVIGGAVMHLYHLPYANAVLFLSISGMSAFQTWHISLLNKKIKELESKS